MEPVLNTALTTELVWHDEFDGDLSLWDQDTLVNDSRDRTGNKYIQPDGSIDMDKPWHSLPGRYAALYDDHRDKCQYIENGYLVMKGHAVKELNPYRENFVDQSGTVHSYGDYKLYTAWLEIKERFGPGTVFEVRVNLEQQKMGGHRWNFWAMPDDGEAYTEDPDRAEIDGPEVENPSRQVGSEFGYMALLKLIGGDSGTTPNGQVDLRKFGIDLRTGWHTFTTVWQHNGDIEFYVDGVFIHADRRGLFMSSRWIMAREMNSGVKDLSKSAVERFNAQYPAEKLETLEQFQKFITDQDVNSVEGSVKLKAALDVLKPWEAYTTGPKVPKDDGLTAQSVIKDIDLIDEDYVLVDYVRIYRVIEGSDMKVDYPTQPDIDLDKPTTIDQLSIDEKIAILASQYERAEAKVAEQAEYIVKLAQSAKDANDLADSKTAELAEYREKTTATINRLKQTENELRAEIATLKKKPIPEPVTTVAPPVSEKSLSRLDALLRRAGR